MARTIQTRLDCLPAALDAPMPALAGGLQLNIRSRAVWNRDRVIFDERWLHEAIVDPQIVVEV